MPRHTHYIYEGLKSWNELKSFAATKYESLGNIDVIFNQEDKNIGY
jgi:hypothetical protein